MKPGVPKETVTKDANWSDNIPFVITRSPSNKDK